MDNNQDLTLTIKAKTDDAVTGLRKVRGEFDNTVTSMKKTGSAAEGMTASIFKGALAYDVFRTAVRATAGFLKSSVEESMDAARIMAQVETNVKNAGFAYDKLAPKIKEYGDNAVKLGFDDEEAAQSLSRLLIVTKDYEQARNLTNLSMDLARSKNISLEDATRAITLVTQGNTRALKEYGIGLDDNATTTDVLREAQDKLKNSAVNYSKTTAGSMATVREEFNNMKQQIGEELTPTVGKMFEAFKEAMPAITALLKTVAGAITAFADGIAFLYNDLVDLGTLLGTGMTKAELDADIAMKKLVMDTEDLAVAYNKVHKEKVTADQVGSNQAIHTAALEAYNKQLGITPPALIKVNNANKTNSDSTDQLTGKYKDLKDALVKVRQAAVDELTDLAKAHDEAVDSSRSKISDLQKSLSDLTYSYQRASAAAQKAFEDQKKNDRMSIASTIIAQREKINALQNQYDTEQDPNKKIGIKEALDKEVAAYAATAQLRIDLSNEISETEARNSMTDLERAVTDYTAKRLQADQDYAANRADAEREYNARQAEIKLELTQTKDKLTKDNAEYMAKRTEINKFLAAAEAERLDTTLKTSKAIIAQIDKEIEKYNALANAIARASQGKAGNLNISLPSHEHGGIVEGPIGMPVPIIAHGGETILPASNKQGVSGGTNIIISLNYPNFTNKDSSEMVRAQIEMALRDVIRNYKLQPA